ncbi:MAG: PLDc N-terminal domain-containing protein [Candidatus Nanopelagicales bacterium]|nr:PLDc N-terminal domain-containing protein [Candidatus Nanopelagicales bacterium]
MARLLLFAIPIAITVYAFFDVLMTPKTRVRTLPKWFWVVAVLVLLIVGALLWFVLGRPRKASAPGGGSSGSGGTYRRPMGPDDDPDFLRGIDNRKPETDS